MPLDNLNSRFYVRVTTVDDGKWTFPVRLPKQSATSDILAAIDAELQRRKILDPEYFGDDTGAKYQAFVKCPAEVPADANNGPRG